MMFEASVNRTRSGLLAAGSLVLAILSLWLIGAFGPPPSVSIKAVVAGWVGVVFFGLCAVLWGRRIFQSGVEIRVDANGLWWKRWSDQTIPWSAIDRAEVRAIRRQRFVSLFLKDPAAFASTTLQGKLAGANKAMGFGDIAVSPVGTDRSLDELAAAVALYLPLT